MKLQKHIPSELENRLQIEHHVPSLRRLSVAVVVVTLALCALWPIAQASRREMVTSGPLTNHHRLLDKACVRCHPSAFRATPDSACEACHTVNQHAAALPAVVAAHPDVKASCTSCHKEHHGERALVPDDSPLCIGCHKRIKKLLPTTEQPDFGDFDHHPEFAIHGWIGDPPVYRRLRLGEQSIRSDTRLKFSHKKHMRLVDDGKPMLTCAGCHATVEDGTSFRPVSFAVHCQRCHAIPFDRRLPKLSVPHGNQDVVLPFITAAVAQLHLDAGETGETARQAVEQESRDDARDLYNAGGACSLCHDIEEVAAPGGRDGETRSVVVRPNIPERWMPASRFSHPTHRFVECESCHAGRSESTSANDIILPSIARCRECHADPSQPGKVASPCMQCHVYHSHAEIDRRYGDAKLQALPVDGTPR